MPMLENFQEEKSHYSFPEPSKIIVVCYDGLLWAEVEFLANSSRFSNDFETTFPFSFLCQSGCFNCSVCFPDIKIKRVWFYYCRSFQGDNRLNFFFHGVSLNSFRTVRVATGIYNYFRFPS
jgi:hypothetical protein